MDGTPQWTEIGTEQGLDHLAMLAPVETHYQSLLQGFSSVTTRLRNYSFYSFWVTHYAKDVRNTARLVFEEQTRRVEALYALAAVQRSGEVGVAGSTFAAAKLGSNSVEIDFRAETSLETPQLHRYLAPAGGAFPGIYFGQMIEIGLLGRGEEHGLPVPTAMGRALAAAYENSIGGIGNDFLRFAEQGHIPRTDLAPLEVMAPSALDPNGEEAALLRSMLMGEDGAAASIQRRATLLSILEIARRQDIGKGGEKITETMLRWWWSEHAPEGTFAETHRAWQHYQVGDMLRLVYESLLNHAISRLEDSSDGLPMPQLVAEVTSPISDLSLERWLTDLSDQEVSLRLLQASGLSTDAPLDAILAPLARIWSDWRHRLDELAESYEELPSQQTCYTELRWLEDRAKQPAKSVIGRLFIERVLRRHLEVAARKFRLQSSYTYVVEVEDGRLRARSRVNLNPSGPRLATAIRFLEDVDLLDDGRITARGVAYLDAL
jgi:hypothetical protein